MNERIFHFKMKGSECISGSCFVKPDVWIGSSACETCEFCKNFSLENRTVHCINDNSTYIYGSFYWCDNKWLEEIRYIKRFVSDDNIPF